MTVVLVHGNPETDAVWDRMVELLGRDDVVRLSPPGFGAPLPPGFGATVDEYRDWLVARLEELDEPVHLVGHDWGGAHVVAVAMHRPDLLRSWVSDVVGLFDPDYVWHDLARGWQTPEDGERSVAAMFGGTAQARAQRLVGRGIDPTTARKLAEGQGEEMGRAVLALYRSAAQPAMAERGQNLEAAAGRPGLAVLAGRDSMVGTDDQRRRAAARAGARIAELPELGHWWMVEDPERAADLLTGWLPLPS